MSHLDDDVNDIPAVKAVRLSGEAKPKQPQWLRIAAIGIVLLGLAAMIQAIDDWVDSRNAEERTQNLNERIHTLNDQFTCRYIMGQQAQELQGQMTLELSLGLAAYASGDEEGLALHTQTIQELSPQLEEALRERANAPDICDNPRE